MPSRGAAEAGSSPAVGARPCIIGTAGHIDHGKSSLVRALTGTDPDRLPEEKRRGMTIELGFAELVVDGASFGVVDVPGHERFVRTMVSGATGVDIALLVVAADDSVMPQTIEHVEILKLLGVSRGVVALTKIDVVDAETADLVEQEVLELLVGTPLADSPVVRVSSVTGEGLDALRRALIAAAGAMKAARLDGPFRMPIDRVFTVPGRGTVATGSILRGEVRGGDPLEIVPTMVSCRARDLHSHGRAQTAIRRGQRGAVNLGGVACEDVERGMELATPGFLIPARLMDVRLECLASQRKPLKSGAIVRLEIATTERRARVVLHSGSAVQPGESAYAQLSAHEPWAATYGQRFILRDENGARTIGGGVVLRPVARRRRRGDVDESSSLKRLESENAEDRVEETLRRSAFLRPSDLRISALAGVEAGDVPAILERLMGQHRWRALPASDAWTTPGAIDDVATRLVTWLRRFHDRNPDAPGRPLDAVVGWLERAASRSAARPLLEELARRGAFKRLGRFACLPEFAPKLSTADEKLFAAMIQEFHVGGFQPPDLPSLKSAGTADRKRLERLARLAVALGELVHIEGAMYLHAVHDAALRATVAELTQRKNAFTVAELREALGSSRKYVVPFVEYLDRAGFTRRVGDQRERVQDSSGH